MEKGYHDFELAMPSDSFVYFFFISLADRENAHCCVCKFIFKTLDLGNGYQCGDS